MMSGSEQTRNHSQLTAGGDSVIELSDTSVNSDVFELSTGPDTGDIMSPSGPLIPIGDGYTPRLFGPPPTKRFEMSFGASHLRGDVLLNPVSYEL